MRIKAQTRIKLLLALFAALLGVGHLACKPSDRGIGVRVKNASTADITNLVLRFTGGNKSSPNLKAGQSFDTKLNPDGSSHLVMEFLDSVGKKHSTNVDVYFERNYHGTILITIEPDSNVRWKDETKR